MIDYSQLSERDLEVIRDLSQGELHLIKPTAYGDRITLEDYVQNLTDIEDYINAYSKMGITRMPDKLATEIGIIPFQDIKIKTDLDHAILPSEEVIGDMIAAGVLAATGGSTLSIQDVQDEIKNQIQGTTASVENLQTATDATIKLLQFEIEEMNGVATYGRLGHGVNGKHFKVVEKQDKLRDDQFIETAEVGFLDIAAISSAAGISADLSGIKKDVSDLKAKDTNLEGTLNGLQNKVDNLATNTVITTIEKKADANTAALANLAANPTISGISSKAIANEAAINSLRQKEQNDINKVNTDLTAAQTAIDTKIAGKADKTVTDALTGRVTTAETKITALETQSSTQASTVTTHTTKIASIETTIGNQAGTLQTHGTTLTGHTQGIAKNVEDIKDLKNLASFMGIYVPSSFPHTTTATEIKTHFGAAKLGMFSFVKASAAGDTYEIWTAEAITVGGVPQATGDWEHEAGADITINMKPYLAMKMKTDLSGQEPPTAKGQVIYGNTLDPQDNKWTNLTEVLKDAYEAKLISANKGKLMTIVNTGTDAAPVWNIDFVEPALQGTDLLMEATGGWSAGYTPQIGDVVVVNEVDADGQITKLGATVAKAMFGASEEKTPGSGVWTAKTDTKDKIALGGAKTTELVYVDNPDFTTETGRRVFAIDNGDTKGAWKLLEKPEINGKANFVGTDTGKILVVKAVDATTGNVELEPIALTEADIQTIKDNITAVTNTANQNELDIAALANLKTDVDTLKDTTVPAIDTRVTGIETFQGYFNDATDGGYVFKTNDTNYETKTLKALAADLVLDTNFGTTPADKEVKLMTEKEVKDAISASLEPRQKELINFQQQKTKPDGTPEYEADGVTPVMIDLGDDKKPVKFTGEKDTALTQASSLATNAAQGVVVTTGSDLTVSQMIGTVSVTDTTTDDDKKLISKKLFDSKVIVSGSAGTTVTYGKLGDVVTSSTTTPDADKVLATQDYVDKATPTFTTAQQAVLDANPFTDEHETRLNQIEAGGLFLGDVISIPTETDADLITRIDGMFTTALKGDHVEIIKETNDDGDTKYFLLTKGDTTWTKGTERTEHIKGGTGLTNLAGYTFTFSDGVTKKVLIQEVGAGEPAGPGIFTLEFDDGTTQKVRIQETT